MSLHAAPVGGERIPKSPWSIVLEYQMEEDVDAAGVVTLRIERDGLYHLKKVSLAYDDIRILVPDAELKDFFNPDLSKVKLFRFFDEKSDKVVWNVTVPTQEEPRAWGEVVSSDVRFVFVGDQYSHVVIREPVRMNEWRLMKKLPGKKPVPIGTESRITGVAVGPDGDDKHSPPDQGGKPDGDTESGRHPVPPGDPSSSEAGENKQHSSEVHR